MRTISKCVVLALMVVFSLVEVGAASSIREADTLFENSTFQEALQVYESVFEESTDDDTRWRAFFRSCESLAHLFRYGEAGQKLISSPVPLQMPYRSRILILRIEILKNVLAQYSYYQRKDVIEGEETDIFRLTPDEIRSDIRSSYLQLWNLREYLLEMNLRDEGYFLDIEDTDFGMYPTLYDYLILNWTDFLLSQEAGGLERETPLPDAEPLLAHSFERLVHLEDSPALLAAELMGEASCEKREIRVEASERWRIRRLLLPLKYYHLFELRALAEDKSVQDTNDFLEARNRAREILLGWMDSFKAEQARAQAGYEVALMLNAENKPLEVVKLCQRIEKDFPGTHAARHAESLRSQIQMPTLYLRARNVLPPAREAFTVMTRNLEHVYFRLYRIEPDRLKDEYLSSNSDFRGWSGILNSPRESWLKDYLPHRVPHKEWSQRVKDEIDYKGFSGAIDPPALETGIYLALASADSCFKMGTSLMSACFFNVTNLVLVGTGGFSTEANDAYYDYIDKGGPGTINDAGFRFYVLNARTGEPVDSCQLNVYTHLSREPRSPSSFLITGKQGSAELSLPVAVSPHASNHYYIDPLARFEGSFSYWRGYQNLSYYPPSPIVLFLETDRPIYRPGHTVQAKTVAVWRRPQGFRTLASGNTVRFYATDPNGKQFISKEVELNEYGSASTHFEIPQGRLLGKYTLHADCTDGRFHNHQSVSFSVEEYKRPEFELLLEPAKESWKYNMPIQIEGKAAYYFGGPVTDAPIKYRIRRQSYIPYYFRHWFGDYHADSGTEIATGELRTDSEGSFALPFTPTPSPQRYANIPSITQFIIEIEGRDSGGRTIQTQKSYRAGRSAIYFTIAPKKGFYLEGEPIEVESKRLTINDTPAPGKSTYQVFRLVDSPANSLTQIGYGNYGGYWRRIPSLDVQLRDTLNGELVAEGTINHNEDGEASLELCSLPQGAYRIVQQSEDRWGDEVMQNKIFVVAKDINEGVPLNAASVTLVETDEYEVGQMARFVIGSGLACGIYHVELWAGEHFLGHELIEGSEAVRLIEVLVTQRMKGGFSLRWFGVKNLDIHYGQIEVSVPWKEKKLSVNLRPFNKELRPGQQTSWGVELKDAQGQPVKGEVLALMYDRSLEYYMRSENPWLDNLYTMPAKPMSWSQSIFEPSVSSVPITEGLLARVLKAFRQPPQEPRLPALRSWRTWANRGYYGTRHGIIEEGVMRLTASIDSPLSKSEVADRLGQDIGKEKGEGSAFSYEEAAEGITTRSEFADTAFFKPHIITGTDGKGQFGFVAPEQLTSWKIRVFAFNQDVQEGTLIEEALTNKELMVRADLPRFFREGDTGTVTAIVHNESEKAIEGELFIQITEHGESINQKLNLQNPRKHFTLQPHSLDAFHWTVQVPQGVATYQVRVAALTDELSDAEQRELPILPSRQRLIESAFTVLQGTDSRLLEILLKQDPTRMNESMVLQIEPQLALSILNTVPFLVEYPYQCVEQILNRYVPLSIINELYKKYPSIRSAVHKIPRRQTPTPPWEKDAPQRLIKLMETPWVWQSEGRPTAWPIIDLLDPEVVNAQKEITFTRLASAQLPNGAFPWWPGGKPDPYITLYVLSGLAEARRYGVEVPEDMIRRGLRYVNENIPLMLEAKERNLATVSFASYVMTSYSPEEFVEARAGFEAARSWVVFLERHKHALTPLGKAYLAYTYLRLGEKENAERTLDVAMDGAREEEMAGVYWTPEKYSWVWYSDTVEKHAFFLRTLQELRPEDKRIPGMVQWLLFNRKGTVWKSTKASVAAIYALLDYFNQQGALSGDEVFKAQWGNDIYSQAVRADDWLDAPIRWHKRTFEITSDDNSAQIQKQGPGIAFASLTWIYSTDQLPEESSPGMLGVQRRFYLRKKQGDSYHLSPIESGDKVSVGDQIEVQLKINTRSQFEYMHLRDPKAAGFEAEALVSTWKHDPLWFYEEQRDSLTNFFIGWLPHGEYILRYRLRPTKAGIYRIGAATLQSMYSPDMSAHSAGFVVEVVE